MCRLFALSGAPKRVSATFWLLDAPDSLSEQSRRDPDGVGVGWYDVEGRAQVAKQPVAAYLDRAFAEEARELRSTTFVAHVRFASTGGLTDVNTHPFIQEERIFAHNGVVQDLDHLEAHLGDDMRLVHGETDSERVFALITRETAANGGDIAAAITAAARWIAAELPLFALNVVLATADELWALRYPDTHELWYLERGAGGVSGARHLEHASPAGSMHVRSGELADRPSVVIASERMDEDPGWRALQSGELLHVDSHGVVDTAVVLDHAPAHLLTLADLDARAAESQSPSAPVGAPAH